MATNSLAWQSRNQKPGDSLHLRVFAVKAQLNPPRRHEEFSIGESSGVPVTLPDFYVNSLGRESGASAYGFSAPEATMYSRSWQARAAAPRSSYGRLQTSRKPIL